MHKKIVSMVIMLALLGTLTVTSFAEATKDLETTTGASSSGSANQTGETQVSIFRTFRDFDNQILCINGIYYVPAREISSYIGATCAWNASDKTYSVTSSDKSVTMTATLNSFIVEAKGRVMVMEGNCLLMNDTVYLPARSFAKIMGLSYWTDDVFNKIFFSYGEALKSANEVYNADDLKWLSRIIYAEARGESFNGKLAVGNVVMNRVKSSSFPNTVYGVIFAANQFSPVRTGKIYNTPDADSVKAAKLALEGYSIVKESVYFVNESASSNSWFKRSCQLVAVIGNHSFYK